MGEKEQKKSIKHIRYLANIILEAASPLAIGAGGDSITNERLVVRDANDLPIIPGTSLVGVLRHQLLHTETLDEATIDHIFGFQKTKVTDKDKPEEKGQGSRLIMSSAVLIAGDGKTVMEGLRDMSQVDAYIASFADLPERDHVRLSHTGVAEKRGKFQEQLVYKGTRFICQMELRGTPEDAPLFDQIVKTMQSPIFRLGAGTRNGFGKLSIVKLVQMQFDLTKKAQEGAKQPLGIEDYLNTSSSLQEAFNSIKGVISDPKNSEKEGAEVKGWRKRTINLKAENFFLFASGGIEIPQDLETFAANASNWLDTVAKKEETFVWERGKPIQKTFFLIPGTSVKGAIAHRLAYHYNLIRSEMGDTAHTIEGGGNILPEKVVSFDLSRALQPYKLYNLSAMNYAEDADWEKEAAKIRAMSIDASREWQDFEERAHVIIDNKLSESIKIGKPVGEENEAVQMMMGFAKNTDEEKNVTGAIGNVIVEDFYLEPSKVKEKIFQHVAIDRFTQGAIDGALFEEKAIQYEDDIELEIWVHEANISDDHVKDAFEATLKDLQEGRLQLGGNTAKGHGNFRGEEVGRGK